MDFYSDKDLSNIEQIEKDFKFLGDLLGKFKKVVILKKQEEEERRKLEERRRKLVDELLKDDSKADKLMKDVVKAAANRLSVNAQLSLLQKDFKVLLKLDTGGEYVVDEEYLEREFSNDFGFEGKERNAIKDAVIIKFYPKQSTEKVRRKGGRWAF